jgi:hypothetical protein
MTEPTITDSVRARLAALEHGGRLTPASVVADAQSPESPLHGLFEWDDRKAAYDQRLHIARLVIRSVRYLAVDETVVVIKAPNYVRDPDAPAAVQGYVSVSQLRADPVSARASLRQEFSRVEGALTRARSVAGVLGLDHEIEDLIAQLVRLRERVAA